jgi:hypothetical protein
LRATTVISSGFGLLWQSLTYIQALWAAYTEAIDRPHNSQYFETAVCLGLEKINTYYERLLIEPEVSIYAVATALLPQLRLLWFKTHWSTSLIGTAKQRNQYAGHIGSTLKSQLRQGRHYLLHLVEKCHPV